MSGARSVAATRADWDAASGATVFFGHQSIGENVVDGLRQLAAENGWPQLHIVEGRDSAAMSSPGVFHTKIGENGDPKSKLDAFRQAVEGGMGAHANIAVMKFCFWDIRRDTDVKAVFRDYRALMSDLQREYPQVTFLYTTVPLVIADNDWRARVRRLLGMPVPTDLDNDTREALNAAIRAEFGPSGRLFDIAALEEGGVSARSKTPHLAAELSSDGAHLNPAGRRIVASGFVKSLAAAAGHHSS